MTSRQWSGKDVADSGRSLIEMVSLHLFDAIEECHETQVRIIGLQAEIETPISWTWSRSAMDMSVTLVRGYSVPKKYYVMCLQVML